MDERLQTLDERISIFDNAQICGMTDPCILTTPAFRLIEVDFQGPIQEGPRNVIKLKKSKYQIDIYNKCTTGK